MQFSTLSVCCSSSNSNSNASSSRPNVKVAIERAKEKAKGTKAKGVEVSVPLSPAAADVLEEIRRMRAELLELKVIKEDASGTTSSSMKVIGPPADALAATVLVLKITIGKDSRRRSRGRKMDSMSICFR